MSDRELHVSTTITSADLDAAFRFVQKRSRKHKDPLEGVSAALYAVMFSTCEGLVDCGLSIESVDSFLEQSRQQVIAQIKFDRGAPNSAH